jgi:hypothetical protein
MASKTMPTQVAEVVKYELPFNGSRRKMLVDQSQTLTVGEIVQKGVAGRIRDFPTPVNEVQTIAITGTLSVGEYLLGFEHPSTKAMTWAYIPFNAANVAAVNTILNAVFGTGVIVCTGVVHTAMVFTFALAPYAGLPRPLIQIETSDLVADTAMTVTRTTPGGFQVAPVNEVHSWTANASSGTYTISVYDKSGVLVTTAAIAFGADPQSAINAVALPAGSIVATGTLDAGSLALTYSGPHFAGTGPLPLASIDATLAPGVAAIVTATRTTQGGSGDDRAEGIMLENITTGSGAYTTYGLVLVGNAVVDLSKLEFGNGPRIQMLAELQARGIYALPDPIVSI